MHCIHSNIQWQPKVSLVRDTVTYFPLSALVNDEYIKKVSLNKDKCIYNITSKAFSYAYTVGETGIVLMSQRYWYKRDPQNQAWVLYNDWFANAPLGIPFAKFNFLEYRYQILS